MKPIEKMWRSVAYGLTYGMTDGEKAAAKKAFFSGVIGALDMIEIAAEAMDDDRLDEFAEELKNEVRDFAISELDRAFQITGITRQ